MARTYGQYCGISAALELVGERWALLIVRDLLVGPRRFTDLRQGLPGVPTNILSARLKELQHGGVVRRAHLAHCGLVYELTEFGRGLEEVVLSLGRWGWGAADVPQPDQVLTIDSLTMALRSAFQPTAAAALPATCYEVHVGELALSVTVAGTGLVVRPVGSPRPVDAADGPLPVPDLVLRAGPAIGPLLGGDVAAAADPGSVSVEAGPAELLARFAATFRLTPAHRPVPPDLLPTLA